LERFQRKRKYMPIEYALIVKIHALRDAFGVEHFGAVVDPAHVFNQNFQHAAFRRDRNGLHSRVVAVESAQAVPRSLLACV